MEMDKNQAINSSNQDSNTNLESHLPNQNETPKPQDANRHRKIIIAVVVVLLVVVGFAGYLLLSKTNQISVESPKTSQNSKPADQQSPANNSLPKLAYFFTRGIALKESTNPDLGGIFVLNTDGTEKKKLSSIDKKDLQKFLGTQIFSPISKEILTNTDTGLVGININTGQQRKISNSQVYDYELSEDYKFVCIPDGSSDPTKQIKINLATLAIMPSGNCHEFKQPYYDPKTKTSVNIQPKETQTGEAGRIILSSEVTVQNSASQDKKVFTYNKPGSMIPLVIANGYLYFKVDASTSSLITLQQMNLNTGTVSEPNTLIPIYEKLQALKIVPVDTSKSSGWVGNVGLSPDGNHYYYFASLSDGNEYLTKVYDYNISSGKETVIKEFPAYSDHEYSTWSSDGRFILISGVLYDATTGKITKVNLPDQQFYIILQ